MSETKEMTDTKFAWEIIGWALDAAELACGDLRACGEECMRLSARLNDIQSYTKYAGLGCQEDDEGEGEVILLGNWNDIYGDKHGEQSRVMRQLVRILEQAGTELEWCDEHSPCCECNGLVRTSPDSYSWKPEFHLNDGDLVCLDCLDKEDYLESLEGTGEAAAVVSPCDYSYTLVWDGLEAGLHPHMTDDPSKIGEALNEAGFGRWVFELSRNSQFHTEFAVWLHDDEAKMDDGYGIIRAKRALERMGSSRVAQVASGV